VCRRRCVQQRDVSGVFCCVRIKSGFNLQERNKLGNLIVTIPQNVGWKEVGKRTKVIYVVEFSTSDERVFMTRKDGAGMKNLRNASV